MNHNRTDRPPSGAEPASAVIAVGRAVGDLRRGGAAAIRDGGAEATAALAAEFADADRLARFAALAGGAVRLAVTARRARALGRAAAGPAAVLELPAPLDPAAIRALADPTADPTADTGARGVRSAVAHARDAGAVALARRAGLLPAAVVKTVKPEAARGLAQVALADLAEDRAAAGALARVGSARVPLAGAERADIVAFRPGDGGPEHLAIVVGAPDGAEPVLARIHSQCFTGDLAESLRCDCGGQLRGAIRRIAEAGAGVVLYLAQEGRGIGLVNKLRAYELQDRGLDTFDANETLGFEADERDYRAAAEMLRQLGFPRVRLMTDNPEKVAGLRRGGVEVAERVPHRVPANRHNARYLAAKSARAARAAPPGGG